MANVKLLFDTHLSHQGYNNYSNSDKKNLVTHKS